MRPCSARAGSKKKELGLLIDRPHSVNWTASGVIDLLDVLFSDGLRFIQFEYKAEWAEAEARLRDEVMADLREYVVKIASQVDPEQPPTADLAAQLAPLLAVAPAGSLGDLPKAGRSVPLQVVDPHPRIIPVLDAAVRAMVERCCPLERRVSLLIEFVNAHAHELAAETKLELAARAETPATLAVELMFTVLAEEDWRLSGATEKWMARFASRAGQPEEKYWFLSPLEPTYFSLRWRALAKLAKVDEPALVEPVLVDLAGAGATFPALYRRACENDIVSDVEWREIEAGLAARPDDGSTTRFAKEWLLLGLWQALAPTFFDELLQS